MNWLKPLCGKKNVNVPLHTKDANTKRDKIYIPLRWETKDENDDMHSLDNLPHLQDAIIDSKSTRVIKSQGVRIVDNEGIKK
jgi:hypothetical protein